MLQVLSEQLTCRYRKTSLVSTRAKLRVILQHQLVQNLDPVDEAQLLVCEKPHTMPHHRRTNSTPSPYLGRFMFGFRWRNPNMKRPRYGEGVELVRRSPPKCPWIMPPTNPVENTMVRCVVYVVFAELLSREKWTRYKWHAC